MFEYKNKINEKKGFTLIELLVVVSIIGMLSSIVLSSMQDARAKARDAGRLSDIKQIQSAIELYRSENGSYPIGSIVIVGDDTTTAFKTALSPYLKTLPKDSRSIDALGPTTAGNTTYNYWYYSPSIGLSSCPIGQAYWLAFRSEKMPQNILNGPTYMTCASPSTKYTTTSTGYRGLWMVGMGK